MKNENKFINSISIKNTYIENTQYFTGSSLIYGIGNTEKDSLDNALEALSQDPIFDNISNNFWDKLERKLLKENELTDIPFWELKEYQTYYKNDCKDKDNIEISEYFEDIYYHCILDYDLSLLTK